MYRERPSVVGGLVVWERVRTSAEPLRILPDGCLDLIWLSDRLVVAGPDTTAQLSTGRPGARLAGVRFAPGVGPRALGVPADELRDRQVDLSDVWPAARVRRLTGRVAGSASAGTVLEEIAAEALRRADPPDPRLAGIVARLGAGASVATTADTVGLGARALHRLSSAAFGYGPKTLGRILRLGRALDLARTGMPFAVVAATAGSADQAHMPSEVRELARVPLRGLIK